MDKSDADMIALLKSFGYEATKIEETDEKTADFLLEHKGFKIVAELKTKGDSEGLLENENATLRGGNVHMHFDSIGRNNRFSGLTGDAVKQIRSVRTRLRADFGMVIFDMLEPYAPTKVEKMTTTLYGRKFAVPLNSKDKTGQYCYYCTNSDFYRHQADLNCVFILNKTRLQVCVNNLALNYEEFLGSGFLDHFEGKYLDPQKEIDAGTAMVIDSDVDRDDPEEVQRYLCSKYGVEAVALMDFSAAIASFRMD